MAKFGMIPMAMKPFSMFSKKPEMRTKIRKKVYEEQLDLLQQELIKVQAWATKTGARIAVLFEGRDTAGKGGVIKRITEHLAPRFCRIVAMPTPSERETTQWYF